jgi:hypothetical protein
VNYFIQIEVATFSDRPKILHRTELVTSAPLRFVDEWLAENRLPLLSEWKYSGQTGSNAPSHRGVLNTLYMQDTKKNSKRLVITTHELVPVDPTSIL